LAILNVEYGRRRAAQRAGSLTSIAPVERWRTTTQPPSPSQRWKSMRVSASEGAARTDGGAFDAGGAGADEADALVAGASCVGLVSAPRQAVSAASNRAAPLIGGQNASERETIRAARSPGLRPSPAARRWGAPARRLDRTRSVTSGRNTRRSAWR
jgi:hypothetical protein